LEDKVHGREVLVEKLTLKNSTYKAAVSKLEAQLAHKEEMGEVLHLVDFDQLKIENQQYMERIDAKNKELLQLKLSTSRAVQVCKVGEMYPLHGVFLFPGIGLS
jgi:capsid portal protein